MMKPILSRTSRASFMFLAAVVVAPPAGPAQAESGWTRWGGPHQNWKADCKKLADQWPADGPKKLWNRDLGDGYSSISEEDGRLYTMYREAGDEGKEVVICLDASTGETVWERKYRARPSDEHVMEFGAGPRATPLICEDRVYSIGVSGMMHCLNKADGKVVWKHDLWKEFKGTVLNHGYSSSALDYKDTVIALVGGKGHSIMAFRKDNGKVAWKKQDFKNSYSTPMLIDVDGQDQLLCFMAEELAAVDPANGKLLWTVKHKNQWGQNVCLPVWDAEDHLLFMTSVAEGGSRCLKLSRNGKKTTVDEQWVNPRVQVHHSNAIRLGDTIYTSTGGRGPGLFHAIDVKTGEILWKERGFAKATFVYGDGKFFVVDEDGNLGMIKPSPEALDIITTVPLLTKSAWTAPTLVGDRLYVRDRQVIMALDVGKS
jgi:outer membrane protein assembly factor BamB